MKKLLTFLLIRIKCMLNGHHYKQVDDVYSYCINCGKLKIDRHFIGR